MAKKNLFGDSSLNTVINDYPVNASEMGWNSIQIDNETDTLTISLVNDTFNSSYYHNLYITMVTPTLYTYLVNYQTCTDNVTNATAQTACEAPLNTLAFQNAILSNNSWAITLTKESFTDFVKEEFFDYKNHSKALTS